MADSELKQVLYELEIALLRPDVRKNSAKIQEIMSEEFFEHCSSGIIYRYNSGDVFDDDYTYKIHDFEVKELGSDYALTVYKASREKQGNDKEYFLRSSIWHRNNGTWEIVFHQGTPSKK